MKDEFDSVSAALDLNFLHEEKSRRHSKLVQIDKEAREVAEHIDEINAKIEKILIELRKRTQGESSGMSPPAWLTNPRGSQ